MPNLKSTTNLAAPAFLDREQLAARWGCSISTLKRRETSGDLVPTRFGPRIVRYAMASIEAVEKGQDAVSQFSGISPDTGASTGRGGSRLASVRGSNLTNKKHDKSTTANGAPPL